MGKDQFKGYKILDQLYSGYSTIVYRALHLESGKRFIFKALKSEFPSFREVEGMKKEFEILKLFLENINRLFTRDEILSRVWTDDVVVLDRTIDVNITRLRKKIEPYGKNIVTRLGYGYCFEG